MTGRRSRTVAALGILLMAAAVAAQGPADAGAEVERLERELVAAIAASELGSYDRLVADDYVATLPDGTELTKPAIMAAYRTGARAYRDLAVRDVRVRVYGDTAVLTARTSGFRSEEGREVENRSLYLRVWVRRQGAWKAVAQLSAPLASGAAKPGS